MLSLAQLTPPLAIGAALTQLFVADKTTRVDKLTVTNPTGGALSVTVYILAAGVPVSDTSIVTATTSIASKAALNVKEVVGQVLNAGDSLQAVASAAGLTAMASGVTQT